MASPGAGRPRDPSIDERVLTATRALLVDVGYSQLTYGLVARTAGVNRPAMYRRWPSKMHLVYEAVFPDQPLPVAEDSGDFETDLRALIHRSARSYRRPDARAALPGLLADLGGDDVLRRSVVDRIEAKVRVHLAELVARATERGQVVAGVDSDALFDCIVGTLMHRVVVRQDN
nr:TetR/AcrR family transcriptional regulator [Micromonospora sp. DSM 115978]